MSLVEIARFQDVYEADLAAAFLASHGVDVDVTERFQTTIDPLMQRALGLRLMGRADQVDLARDLLARAGAGEFATEDESDLPLGEPTTRAVGRGLALFMAATGGFASTSLPRQLRPVHWIGVALIGAVAAISLAMALTGIFSPAS